MDIEDQIEELLEREGYEVISSSTHGNGDESITFRLLNKQEETNGR